MLQVRYAWLLRRYSIWIACAWTLLVVVALAFYAGGEAREFRYLTNRMAEQLLARDLSFQHWNASSGGVYVPITANHKPNPYLLHIPEREITTPSGRLLTLVDPNQMVLQTIELAGVEVAQTHLASLNPIRPENAADDWEAEGLRKFQQGALSQAAFVDSGEQKFYRYMRPLIVSADCLGCHAPHGFQPGQVRGAYAITLSVKGLYDDYQRHVLFGMVGGFLLWFGGISGGLLLGRRLSEVEGDCQRGEEHLTDAKQNILYLTHYDPLTGLPNRLLFHERLQAILADASPETEPLAVGVIGIDHFKKLKNSIGVQMGEELLKEAVKRMATVFAPEDLFACLSESRLLVLLTGVGEAREVAGVVRKLRESLAQPVILNGQEFFVSVTIGFALAPEDSRDAKILISYADAAFSRAKLQGRDSFQLYTAMLNQQALEQISLENSLRRALERNQLELFFQPQVDSRSGRILGAEALLRWRNPERGMISPLDFIPLAEESGMILAIGEWVLLSACQKAKPWRELIGDSFTVSVNVSPRQFQQTDLVGMVDEALALSGLPPSCLVLEVTEGSIMHNVEKAAALLGELKKRGIRIAIDDFGTGYSSLNYFKLFPIDQVKIDKSFVTDLNQRGTNSVIVTAIVSLAHKLNLEIVAEGVETEFQRDFLQALGCYSMQGYYYCRPMAADKFSGLVQALQDESSDSYAWWSEAKSLLPVPVQTSPYSYLYGK